MARGRWRSTSLLRRAWRRPTRLFVFKNAVKELAQQAGYMASFMTKPYADQSASGCHYHPSLLRTDDDSNAFYDPAAADGLSEVARHWIGGQLEHAPALTAIAAPTINCAKRYKLFSLAPMNATWGHEDRTVAVRVNGGRGADMHLENRMPCAGTNPTWSCRRSGGRHRRDAAPTGATAAHCSDRLPG